MGRSPKFKNKVLYDQAIFLVGIDPQDSKSAYYRNTYPFYYGTVHRRQVMESA
jgi:hypothetical protein